MKTIRDLYAAALEERLTLLKDIIELLVIEKKKMDWSDPIDRIYEFIKPPDGKKEAWNHRYKEELAKMKAKREEGNVRHG
jgi:hypothetical protein